MEGFDITYFHLMFNPCTSYFPHGFYFSKSSKFPFLTQTWISHNFYLRKGDQLFWSIGFFTWDQKCELSRRKRKPRFWVCVIKSFQAWHHRTSFYLTIAWVRSIVVRWIIHLFYWVNFVQSLGRLGRCVSKVCWTCVSYFVTRVLLRNRLPV